MEICGNDTGFKLMAAPLQGFTEAPFRHFHAEIYGSHSDGITYYSPFVRIEKGEARKRDIRDISSKLNENHCLVPQVIAGAEDEFRMLVENVAALGFDRMDLNMGCPFVPQVRKGRGAGLLGNPGRFAEIADVIRSFPEISFSIKMRLGIERPDQWKDFCDLINTLHLRCVILHPRTAVQQYKGELHMDQLKCFCEEIHHPVVFNGEISSPDDIKRIHEGFPCLHGVMAGRGLLRRPSLFAEYISGICWDEDLMREKVIDLHRGIFNYYSSVLCWDTQLLLKMKPLWEYLGSCFPKKQVKQIVKSHTISSYIASVEKL